MRSPRLRAGLVAVTAAAVVFGGLSGVTTASATVAPAPGNLKPDDPASAPSSPVPSTTLRHDVILTWNPVAGAKSYDVEVTNGPTYGGTNGSFPSTNVSATTAVSSLALPPSLPHGDYAWHVRVHATGAWSTIVWFTRGWGDSPANPVEVSTHGPVLTWDAVPDASYYEIGFSSTPWANNPAFDENASKDDTATAWHCETTATSFSPGQMVRGKYSTSLGDEATSCSEIFFAQATQTTTGPLYWRVRARDGVLDTADDVVSGTPPAQSCTGVFYLRSPAEVESTPECSAWSYPSVDGVLSEHVSTDGTNPPAPPTNPTLSPSADPSASPVVITNSPVFSWTPAGDGNDSFYRVYVSRNPDMSTQDYVWETTSDAYAPIVQLGYHSTRWYWTVQSCAVPVPDTSGSILGAKSAYCSSPTPAQAFIELPTSNVQPSSTTPVTNNGTVVGLTLEWQTLLDASKPSGGLQVASPDAMGYEIEVSDSRGSFATPTLDFLVDNQGEKDGYSSVTLPIAALPTGFLWRVRAVDESQNEYPWSDTASRGGLTSASGVISTPSGFGLTQSLDVLFNAPVSGVGSSSLHVVDKSNGVNVPGSVTQVDDVTFRFTPSGTWAAGGTYGLALTSAVKDDGNGQDAVASSHTVRAATLLDSGSPAVTRHAGDYPWTVARATDAVNGSYLKSDDRASTSARSYLDMKVRGSSAAVYACMGPNSGNVALYVDGVRKATVSLYRSYNDCTKVATLTLSSSHSHTVRFAALGSKSSRSHGTAVRFDALRLA